MKFASRYEAIPERFDEPDLLHKLTSINLKFNVTKRNWMGEKYTTYDEALPFINGVLEWDKKISSSGLSLQKEIPVTFVIDASVFSSPPEKNEKLLAFLKELDTLNQDQTLDNGKYLSKLRYFGTKPENFGYLYRWAVFNPQHPLSATIKQFVMDQMIFYVSRFKKKYSFSQFRAEELLQRMNEYSELYNKTEEEQVGKLVKYSYSDPSLFIFNAFFVSIWFSEQYKNFRSLFPVNYVITQYKLKKTVHTDIYQGVDFHLNCIFYQELMGDYMGLINNDIKWYIGSLRHLERFPDIPIDESVLYSIARWVVKKIYNERKRTLPQKPWYTEITWDFLRDAGFEEITFIREKTIVGENGEEELIVYGKVRFQELKYIVFPLIDPAYWRNLNKVQKALLTYALCLYHDIVVEDAFDFKGIPDEEWEMKNPFIPKPEKLVFEGIKVSSRAHQTHDSTRTKKRKHKPPKEHWVTFHFRKLNNREASEEAKERAAKYGIEIPEGFTFVDSYVRGGAKVEDENQLGKRKISALDIFSRTVSKISSPKK